MDPNRIARPSPYSPSPYSLQLADSSSTNNQTGKNAPRERDFTLQGPASNQFHQGPGARVAPVQPSSVESLGWPQQIAASYTPSSGYEDAIKKKVVETNVQFIDVQDRGPPPSYSEKPTHSEAASRSDDEVELHGGLFGGEPPQALQTMVKMVTMLNFMKVELGDQKTLRSKEQWRAAAAEFIGTLLFVYLGCGSVVASRMISQEMTCARLVCIALAHGLAICFLAGATGAISGGHLNPAVTLAFVVAGKETLVRAGLYVGAQLFGAIIGAWLLQCSTPSWMEGHLGSHDLAPYISAGEGCLVEMMLTFVLIFVIFGVAVDRRGPGVIAPIPIGFAVLVDHLVGVPYTGASMNPARSFGPALVSGYWGQAHIIYWFGPCVGAVMASAVYRLGFLEPSLVHAHEEAFPTER